MLRVPRRVVLLRCEQIRQRFNVDADAPDGEHNSNDDDDDDDNNNTGTGPVVQVRVMHAWESRARTQLINQLQPTSRTALANAHRTARAVHAVRM